MGPAAKLQVPIKLTLAQSDNVSSVPVKPVYLLASRQSYLPALAEQVLRSFEHVLLKLPGQGAAHTPWFEFRGAPVSWTLPCGVLLDIASPPAPAADAAGAGAAAAAAAGGGGGPALPWALTVHYRDVPAALVPAWCNAGAAREQYFTSLKEALYICRGPDGANAAMRMSPAAQDELWRCVVGGRGPEDAAGWAALRASPSVRQGHAPLIPVRIFIVPPSAGEAAAAASWEDAYSTSRPIESLQPDGCPTTVAHALYKVAPRLFTAPPPPPAAARVPAAVEEAAAEAAGSGAGEGVAGRSEGEAGPAPAAAAAAPSAGAQAKVGAAAAGGRSGVSGLGPLVSDEGGGTADAGASGRDTAGRDAAGGSGAEAAGTTGGGAAATSGGDGGAAAASGDAAAAAAAAAAVPAISGDAGPAEGGAEGRPSSSGGAQGAAAAALSEALAAARRGPHPSSAAAREWAARAGGRCRAVVSGVQVPLHAPLAWLHERLHAGDYFLYLVVHTTE